MYTHYSLFPSMLGLWTEMPLLVLYVNLWAVITDISTFIVLNYQLNYQLITRWAVITYFHLTIYQVSCSCLPLSDLMEPGENHARSRMDIFHRTKSQCRWHNHKECCTLTVPVLSGNFYAPSMKGPSGHLGIRSSVRLFVPNSIPLINKWQYLKFGWWISDQTCTVSLSKGYSHFTDITCPWGLGGVKMYV